MNIALVGAGGTLGEAIYSEACQRDMPIVTISKTGGEVPIDARWDLIDFDSIQDISVLISPATETVAIINSGVLGPVAHVRDGPMNEMVEAFKINALSNIKIFQVLFSAGVRKFIVISSGAALKRYRGWFAYCASKELQKNIWESIAFENPEISVSLVAPGVLDSKMHKFTEEMTEDRFPDLKKFFEIKKSGKYQNTRTSVLKLFDLLSRHDFFEEGCKYIDLRNLT